MKRGKEKENENQKHPVIAFFFVISIVGKQYLWCFSLIEQIQNEEFWEWVKRESDFRVSDIKERVL